ncbi:hypothetical protein [Streptomyces sp. NBC_00829]|uniref:hypothetical protein n=1 Tax=Streptomyces sp. NBC_00829 TaxID=2903679 RepID=UPI0038684B70|nr:hypothetical protein OG293_37420 [Streptomyces sp. NBC_00829]
MTAAPEIRVVLAVDPQHFTGTLRALREAGLAVEADYPDIGSVTGTVREDRLDALRAIDGVEAVELERSYRLPPTAPQ